ncbi:MAG: carbohydrate ABC transporter permease [Psychrilyobacter sp.]|uniref:carbohydrate ABC transporter permease n=1 Tax=Psychrilyobacter sp. TaxID=2586924 RepID=UPI003C7917C7
MDNVGVLQREKVLKKKINLKRELGKMSIDIDPVKIFKHISLIGMSLAMIFPFIWMISSSLKTNYEIWNEPFKIIPDVPQWFSFVDAFKSAPFGMYLFNSGFTAIIITFILTINSAMFAYAITQFKFKGRGILFAIIMGIYMLPTAVTYVPSYIILARMNLLDSYTGLIFSNAASIFGIFLFRQTFLKVNESLIEAARIDGASEWTILWKIVFPITKPSFVTFGLITFITNYNSYLWPSLIIKSPERSLISIGLRQFFIQDGAYGINWSQIMAGSTIAVMPLLIIFVFTQKFFINGIADSGVKE